MPYLRDKSISITVVATLTENPATRKNVWIVCKWGPTLLHAVKNFLDLLCLSSWKVFSQSSGFGSYSAFSFTARSAAGKESKKCFCAVLHSSNSWPLMTKVVVVVWAIRKKTPVLGYTSSVSCCINGVNNIYAAIFDQQQEICGETQRKHIKEEK